MFARSWYSQRACSGVPSVNPISTQSELKQPPSATVAAATMSILRVVIIVSILVLKYPDWRSPMRVGFLGSGEPYHNRVTRSDGTAMPAVTM